MGLRLICPAKRGFYPRSRGLCFRIAKSGYVFLADDLVKDFGLTNGQRIAVFANEDTTPHTLAFMVCSSSNPNGLVFHPRSRNMRAYIYNKGIYREGAQVGQWNITEKKDDIYYTDCPVLAKEVETGGALDIIDEIPAAIAMVPKRKYTRRAR